MHRLHVCESCQRWNPCTLTFQSSLFGATFGSSMLSNSKYRQLGALQQQTKTLSVHVSGLFLLLMTLLLFYGEVQSSKADPLRCCVAFVMHLLSCQCKMPQMQYSPMSMSLLEHLSWFRSMSSALVSSYQCTACKMETVHACMHTNVCTYWSVYSDHLAAFVTGWSC